MLHIKKAKLNAGQIKEGETGICLRLETRGEGRMGGSCSFFLPLSSI